jgi:phosphatidylglycerophosphatase A
VPIGIGALHGASTGWNRWVEAMIGYRLSQRSALANAEWFRLEDTALAAAPALVPAVLAIVVAGALAVRTGSLRLPVVGVLATWSAVALVSFVSGGQFFRHYWIMLVFPLGTCAGVALSTLPSLRWRRVVAAGVLTLPVVMTAVATTYDRNEIGERLHDDWRLAIDEDVATWFTEQADPGDTIYAQCASPALYGNLDVDPPYPYLWFDAVKQYPGALQRLRALMAAPDRPRFVVAYQTANFCDPSGELLDLVLDGYQHVHTIGERRIYERRS